MVWLFGYRWERKQYNFVETLLYVLATCKNLWSCMWPILFPFKYGNFEPVFQKRILCTNRSPFCFCHKKRGERGISPLSIWKMQLRSLGFSAKKREIHQATNKQTNWNYIVWLIKASVYLWHSLSMCPTLIAWSSWCENSLGHKLEWIFYSIVCAFWFLILSPESSPWALWSLVAGSSASSLGIYSIAAPLLHWLLHVLTHVIMSWLKSAVCVISKECAMVYYFKPFFSHTLFAAWEVVRGTRFHTQFGPGIELYLALNFVPNLVPGIESSTRPTTCL